MTTGPSNVAHFTGEDANEEATTLALAAKIATASSHALSSAIVEFARAQRAGMTDDVSDVRVVPGLGVVGVLAPSGSSIVLGSRRFLIEQQLSLGPGLAAAVEDAESRGLPLSSIGWDGRCGCALRSPS